VLNTLLDRRYKISTHIYDQAKPREYAERQVREARSQIALSVNDQGVIFKTPANICVALLRLGVTLRYNRFADRMLIEGLPDFGPVLEDAALDRLWLLLSRRYRLTKLSKDLLRTVVSDVARLNGFHPVRDYLDGLQWDGKPRIDAWLIAYGDAEDTEYSRAVGALILVAAVRRVRQPGCKFDEMVVIENPEQGTEKSTMLATLAGREDWFSDDLPLNITPKEVIERLRGRWIVEAAELSGMRRADIEHLKAFLSRQIDRARMAYGHFVAEAPRECIIVGTTNAVEYLKDTSGNRRFWPVRCRRFDILALRRDRDQLWAEAATREAAGASIRLDPRLWPKAAEEQEQRLTRDPWFDALQAALGDMEGKISSASVWEILDVRGGHQTQEQSRRVGDAMRQLGWRRANKARTIKFAGKDVMGWVRGEQPWRRIWVWRDKDGRLAVLHEDDDV
jgi:predicted P-loop ATPase